MKTITFFFFAFVIFSTFSTLKTISAEPLLGAILGTNNNKNRNKYEDVYKKSKECLQNCNSIIKEMNIQDIIINLINLMESSSSTVAKDITSIASNIIVYVINSNDYDEVKGYPLTQCLLNLVSETPKISTASESSDHDLYLICGAFLEEKHLKMISDCKGKNIKKNNDGKCDAYSASFDHLHKYKLMKKAKKCGESLTVSMVSVEK